MNEYDEMYGIEDDFEQQFADELEVMAEMEREHPSSAKVSEFRNKKLIPQTFEEAIVSGDVPLRKSVNKQCPESISPPVCEEEESLSEKRDKMWQKKLELGVENGDDITPPSSPEVYDRPARDGPGFSLSLSPDREAATEITTSVLDISGMTALQESPKRVTAARRHAQKRPPAVGDYITVTDSMGNRVYLNKKEDKEKAPEPRAFRNSLNGLGLLTIPIEVLKEQIAERVRIWNLVEESQRLTELMNGGVGSELLAEEQTDSGMDGESGEDEGSSSRLWVDQFSPHHYTDLLSDDFTNHCLLKWLKLWDTVVFGRERKPRSAPADIRANFTNAQNQNQSQRFKTKSQMTEEILEAELDQYKITKFKASPPGLGKTTLAHIIAKHAGYNVVEINASDDRSAELFQKRIDTATQMKSVLGANEKPNCLIIDEIDGSPAAAINILLATLNRKDNREGEESGVNALKKKKKKQSVLLRPIICICNDLYVPALRPLRQQAFLLAFPQTLPSRLAQRLAEITKQQGMKADTGTLMALCEKTDNDIRACINTFLCAVFSGQKHLDQRSVSSVSVGLKDQNKGLFSVWQEIFQLPRLKRKRIGGDTFGGFDEEGPKDGTQRLQHILHLVSSNGEHEKLTQGLYDNFLSMKLKDPGMLGVCAGLDWMCFSDLLNECVLHGQNYSLMRYFPFLPAAFHHLYAANSVPRINYPHSHYEAFTKSQHTKNALLAMLNDIPPAVQSRISMSSLCLDILSLLLELISPKLRPVSDFKLYDLIDTMINYNLTYRQDRTPEGQYTYVLEPNVEDVVHFLGLPPRRQLTYQVKQLIARETELERMRKMEKAQQKRNPHKTEAVNKVPEEKKTEVKKQTSRNHQQRLENIVKQTVVESRPELDFFGRAIVPKEKPVVTTTSEDGKGAGVVHIGKAVGNSDVWFRFNEGVSNAVRRNVYIRELL
uniref:CTF18, chromosome transmission fidelity factor 18 homolog (S. cerevisiae) n=1 Tax=Cyprinus carpio carpio TaxID=630221 RepID=A0A9J7ZDF6_CYPCA